VGLDRILVDALEDLLQVRNQIEHGHAADRQFVGFEFERSHRPRVALHSFGLPILQVLGDHLELSVLDQSLDELFAGVDLFALFVDRRSRKEHLRLDPNERGRHDQVLPGQLQIELLHEAQMPEILGGDVGDRDIRDVQLVPLDEVQEQIERPLECVELDAHPPIQVGVLPTLFLAGRPGFG
jgi:hypothetical protein